MVTPIANEVKSLQGRIGAKLDGMDISLPGSVFAPLGAQNTNSLNTQLLN
jgi:hypothetical protein